MYGDDYYNGPRQYQTKVATRRKRTRRSVRPSSAARRSRSSRVLDADELQLYDLIWKRAIASQMADARMLRTTVEITGDGTTAAAVFTASGKAIEFAGFLRAYVEGSDDPAAELDEQETLLPACARRRSRARAGERRARGCRRRPRPEGA